jgi:hypothetical protein
MFLFVIAAVALALDGSGPASRDPLACRDPAVIRAGKTLPQSDKPQGTLEFGALSCADIEFALGYHYQITHEYSQAATWYRKAADLVERL